MLGVNTQAYLPLGDLYLEHGGAENFSHYQRELDLDSGIAKVAYHTETGDLPAKPGSVHPTVYVSFRPIAVLRGPSACTLFGQPAEALRGTKGRKRACPQG